MAKAQKRVDYIFLGIVAALLSWGLFTLATVSFPFSLENYKQSWHYFLHQLLFGFLPGLLLAFVFFRAPLEFLKKWGPLMFLGNLFLLVLVFFPGIGVKIGGASRWVKFGPLFFQPSEFLKISVLLYLAAWLSKKTEMTTKIKSKLKKTVKRSAQKKILLGPLVVLTVLGVLCLTLLAQPDMSSLGIICVIVLCIYFVAPTSWWHTLLFLLLLGGAGMFFIKFSPYRWSRLDTFLNPEADPLGIGYQVKQALIGIGSGRYFGIQEGFAFGLSRQKFGFLPYPMSDSIFAIIGEELGLLGGILLISLFLLFTWRGLSIAKNAPETFLRLLAVGIVGWITFQALFNIGGMLGIVPLAGIPLPFFSYGGSHLIAEMVGVGLLLNIAKH